MNFLKDIETLKAELKGVETLRDEVARLRSELASQPRPRSWRVRVNDADTVISERDGIALTAALMMSMETRKPVQVALVSGEWLELREGDFAMLMAQILAAPAAAQVAAGEPVS